MASVVVRPLRKRTSTAASSSKSHSLERTFSMGESESTAASDGHSSPATPADSLSVSSDSGRCPDADVAPSTQEAAGQSEKSVLCFDGVRKLARHFSTVHPVPVVLTEETAAEHDAAPTSEVAAATQPTEESSCTNAQPRLSFAAQDPLPSLIRERLQGLSLAPLAEELHANEWPEGSLMAQFFEALGATEVEVLPWLEASGQPEDGGAVSKTRLVRMRVPMPAIPMYPRNTRQTMSYRITVAPPEENDAPTISIESSGISHDAPFGDKFVVEERIVLRPDELGAGGVVVEQFGRCNFHQSCGMLQSRVTSSTLSGIQRQCRNLVALLQDRASAPICSALAASCVPELVAQSVGAECATCLGPATDGCSGRIWWPRAPPRRRGFSCTRVGTGSLYLHPARRGASSGATVST